MLPKGTYLGELYDIAFDKPEAHAIAKDGVLHYAFFARSWNGPIALRGLAAGRRYTLDNGFTGAAMGADGRRRRVDPREFHPCPAGARHAGAEGSRVNLAAAQSGRSWLVYALTTVVLWGIWGALSGLSASTIFPTRWSIACGR